MLDRYLHACQLPVCEAACFKFHFFRYAYHYTHRCHFRNRGCALPGFRRRQRTNYLDKEFLMEHNVYIYIFIMAGVSYLIRVLPLTLIRKEIKNRTIRSFLFYVPYVTLAVMTFPAILESTNSVWSGLLALIIGIVLAWCGKSLFQVAVFSCLAVFILELFL